VAADPTLRDAADLMGIVAEATKGLDAYVAARRLLNAQFTIEQPTSLAADTRASLCRLPLDPRLLDQATAALEGCGDTTAAI